MMTDHMVIRAGDGLPYGRTLCGRQWLRFTRPSVHPTAHVCRTCENGSRAKSTRRVVGFYYVKLA
jgi:hypothetical protein